MADEVHADEEPTLIDEPEPRPNQNSDTTARDTGRLSETPAVRPEPHHTHADEPEGPDIPETPSAATSAEPEPGKVSDRLAWIAEADRLFVEGDFVAGDKNVYYLGKGKRRVRMPRLAPQVEDPARSAFAEPGDWAQLQEGFSSRNAAVLVAPSGFGGTTVATRLLIDAGNEPIYDLDATLDLRLFADLVEDGDPEKRIPEAGFLLRVPRSPTALSGAELQKVERLLSRVSARLIVVTGPDARLGDDEVLDLRLELKEPPAHRLIFENHLRERMGSRNGQILEQDGLSAMVDDLLSPDLHRRRAAHLAAFIQQKERDGIVDLAAVQDLMEQRDTDDFTIWFDNLFDRGDGQFIVALAVLDGLPFEDVLESSKKLARDLGATARQKGKYWNRLAELRACTVQTYARNGAFGRTVVPAITYKDGAYPRKIIEHFWRRGGRNEGFLRWLTNLSSDSVHSPIGIRAASTLGRLSLLNFDHLYRKVFLPWSGEESRKRRDVVALALRAPASTKRTTANVVRLIDDWHGLQGDPRRQATAARAYGMALRDEDPHLLLDRLGRLAVVSNDEVVAAVGESLSELIGRNYGRLAPMVLRELANWRHNYRREHAVVHGFLAATSNLVAEVRDDQPEGTPVLWPTLLLLADQNPQLRDDLCDLWACALTSWTVPGGGQQALTHWAVMAERDGGARQALTYLLGAVSQTDDRTQRIVRRIATEWASPDHLQSVRRTAEQVKEHLDRLDLTAPVESKS
ncbi:hypothetical protein [Actinoplanes subglobosus]|uniref:Uncharacterized protein n=1 Tax=Actinoplanes subglobosus TaxID=1547892 RepID=A0ABV8IHT2_9ACTN